MSQDVFPDTTKLKGLAWSVIRTPTFKTSTQIMESGRESRSGGWQMPLWKWQLVYEFLRDDPNNLDEDGYTELTRLAGFYLAHRGSLSSFLYQDQKDNQCNGQRLGLGDGSTTAFQLVRQYGPFTEAIQTPAGTPVIYLAGAPTTAFTVDQRGVVTFTSPPGNGALITADFGFYFRCRFADDSADFEHWADTLWNAKQINLQQVKI